MKMYVMPWMMILGSIGYSSNQIFSINATITPAESSVELSSSNWDMKTSNDAPMSIGQYATKTFTPEIVFKAPNESIANSGMMLQLSFHMSNNNWHGLNKLVVEETNLGISSQEMPLGGEYIFLKNIKPTIQGISIFPKFTLSGILNSSGDINEVLTITATYI